MDKRILLVIFGLSGMAALIYEIIWIRPLSIVFGTTMYAASTIIGSFILGLAVGSWLAGRFSDRIERPLYSFGLLQIGIGVYGVLLLPVFSLLPDWYIILYELTYPNQMLFMLLQVMMAISLISIPATMMGTTLPLMMRSYSTNFKTIGHDVGKLDASNSIGAVIGTFAAGFLLVPIFGIQNSIIITAAINVAIGSALLLKGKHIHFAYVILLLVLIGVLFYFMPGYNIENLSYGAYAYHDSLSEKEFFSELMKTHEIKFYKESLYGTVLVLELPQNNHSLIINGKTQCSTIEHVEEGLINLASVPYELFEHNFDKPKNALNVGLGCGTTSKWLGNMTNTTTIEIDPVVTETTEFFHSQINHELIIDDGRNWLLKNDERFDLITTEPFDPFVNNGAMYTLEYFQILNEHTTENGLVTQWVPNFELEEEDFFVLYNTFHKIFPHIYIYQMEYGDNTQWIMIGSKKPLMVYENELFLFSNEEIMVKDTELSTDDKPILEFSVSRNIYG